MTQDQYADIYKYVGEFEWAEEHLKKLRRAIFPPGRKVVEDSDRYKGPGVVTNEDSCPANQLPVRLPNHNVWWYRILDVKPA